MNLLARCDDCQSSFRLSGKTPDGETPKICGRCGLPWWELGLTQFTWFDAWQKIKRIRWVA